MTRTHAPTAAQRATTAIAEWMRYRSWDVVRHRDHIAGIIEQEYAGVVEALEECSADLAALIDAQYAGMLDHPTMAAKRARDMRPVEQARAAIAKARGGEA